MERENISIIIRFFDNDQKLRIELLLRMTPLIHHNLIFRRKQMLQPIKMSSRPNNKKESCMENDVI